MKEIFLQMKIKILDILFPAICLNCQKEGTWICQNCLSLIEILEYQYCPFCQERVFACLSGSQEKGTCKKHRGKNLNGLFFAASYKNPLVKKLIKRFKYSPLLKELAPSLSSLIITHFISSGNKIIFNDQKASLFIPVPLSPAKKRWRGFNQSEEIAKELSKFLKIPYQVNNLIKIKKTQSQVELKKEEREENIKNAFRVKNPQVIQGKRIFLIDDIFTSGATMEECARVLKKAGAKQVWGIAVAREESD